MYKQKRNLIKMIAYTKFTSKRYALQNIQPLTGLYCYIILVTLFTLM